MTRAFEKPAGRVLGFGPLPTGPFSVMLQEEAKRVGDDFPKQTCGDTFKTKGRFELTFKGELTLLQALAVIAAAYKNAEDKAKRFCKMLSEPDCQGVEFVKYESFDSDATPTEGGGKAFVELEIVWKCVKS